GARRRIGICPWQRRRLVVVVVVHVGGRARQREGCLTLGRCANNRRLGVSRSDQSPGPQRGDTRQQKLAHSVLLFAPADPANFPGPDLWAAATWKQYETSAAAPATADLVSSWHFRNTVSGLTQSLQASAPIAPIALQTVAGSRRARVPAMPPSAATGSLADRAI